MKKFIALLLIAFIVPFAVFAGGQKEQAAPAVSSSEVTEQNASAITEFNTDVIEVTEDNIVRGGKLVVGTRNELSSYAPWRYRKVE